MRDANEYVARQHFSISLLQPMAYSLVPAVGQRLQRAVRLGLGARRGSGVTSFYVGRFWIDSKMKKQYLGKTRGEDFISRDRFRTLSFSTKYFSTAVEMYVRQAVGL